MRIICRFLGIFAEIRSISWQFGRSQTMPALCFASRAFGLEMLGTLSSLLKSSSRGTSPCSFGTMLSKGQWINYRFLQNPGPTP